MKNSLASPTSFDAAQSESGSGGSASLRVLHVAVGYFPALKYGGPIYSVHFTAQALARAGLDIYVATSDANGDSRIDVDTAKAVTFEPRYHVRYYHDEIIGKFSSAFVRNIAHDIRSSDLVHLQDVYSPHAAQTFMLAARLGKPLVVSPRGIFSTWALASRRRAAKQAWLNVFVRPFVRDTRRVAWHATSPAERNDILRVFPGAIVHVIPNAIDCSLFDAAPVLPRTDYIDRFFPECAVNPQGSKVLVSMGRLHPVKGFDIALEVLARVNQSWPGAVLLIAGGDDGEGARLRQVIASAGLADRAKLVGPLHDDDKIAFLKGADIFLFPSHSENFGLACLESLAAGTPVVASRQTPWEILETDGAGIWVDNTADAMSPATNDLLTRPREEMQLRARACAARFDLSAVAASFHAIYRELSDVRTER